MITLATLSAATAQQVFDQVVTHMFQQGCRCIVAGTNQCCYRVGELKCAAGCLISNEEYKDTFEGKTWYDLADTLKSVPETHSKLIRSLQCVHDNRPVEEWPKFLQIVARDFELKYNPPVGVQDVTNTQIQS